MKTRICIAIAMIPFGVVCTIFGIVLSLSAYIDHESSWIGNQLYFGGPAMVVIGLLWLFVEIMFRNLR